MERDLSPRLANAGDTQSGSHVEAWLDFPVRPDKNLELENDIVDRMVVQDIPMGSWLELTTRGGTPNRGTVPGPDHMLILIRTFTLPPTSSWLSRSSPRQPP